MVAAGVFLVARLDPYAQFPVVQTVIAVVGTITCFLGASIALTQMDLKKGLAYSTVSQLGYMMLAMGCGAPVAGIFHLRPMPSSRQCCSSDPAQSFMPWKRWSATNRFWPRTCA